jgi:hypothetical protein
VVTEDSDGRYLRGHDDDEGKVETEWAWFRTLPVGTEVVVTKETAAEHAERERAIKTVCEAAAIVANDWTMVDFSPEKCRAAIAIVRGGKP